MKEKKYKEKKKRQVKISQRIPHDEELAYQKILTILHPVRFLVVNPVHTWILPINLPNGPIHIDWTHLAMEGTRLHSVPTPGRAGSKGEHP